MIAPVNFFKSLLLMSCSIVLSYQMTLRILFNWQHGYELKKALQESKELKQQLTQKLEVIQEERALMQQCSIGHDSRARFYFALKKAEERYIDLAEEE